MIESKYEDKGKQFKSILKDPEARAMNYLVPKVPKFVTSKHLTLASIPIAIGVITCGYYAPGNMNLLYLFSALIFLHWLTDALDGHVARYRKENEPRWGFYMDHFLDYVYMCSFVVAYSFLVSDPYKVWVYALIPLMGALIVSEYLRYGAVQKFTIAHFGFGVLELHASMMILNTFMVYYGTVFFEKSLPFIDLFFLLIVILTVFKNQKEILKIDRELKK